MATIFRVTAALLLLLSTGLLNYAQGSFPSPDDKAVFPDFDFEGAREQFEKVRAQTSKHKDALPASAGTAGTVGRPGGDQARPDIPVAHLTPLSEAVQGSALNTHSRRLQEGDCSDAATPIFVSSTVFPLMEGCLSPVVTDESSGYASDTALIVRMAAVDSSDTTTWIAGYSNPSGETTLACISEGNADLLDPSETVWYCDTDGDGSEFLLADDELSVSCGGCSITSPSPMITAAPAPSTTVAACGEGDSFSIASETNPVTEGCYLGTAFASNDEVLYTPSGTDDFGQMWVVALTLSGEGSSTAGNVHWFLVDVAASGENDDSDFLCASEEEAALYHPSEVLSWRCSEGVSIDMACGCSSSTSTVTSPISPTTPTPIAPPRVQPTAASASTPAPTSTIASPISPRTPTPIAPPRAQPTAAFAPTPSPTSTIASPISPTTPTPTALPNTTVSACGEGDSFSIVSETLPVTEGCYLGTAFASNDEVLYTPSGTDDFGQMWVVALTVSGEGSSTAGNVHWFVVDVAASGENDDSDFLCASEEEASLYHPSEVSSWRCSEGVSIDMACGCSSSTSTVTSPISPTTPTPIAPPRVQPTAASASTPAPTSTIASSISPRTPTPIAPTRAQPTAAPASTPAPTSTIVSPISPRTPTPIAPTRAQPTAAPASTPSSSPVTANEPASTANTCPGDGSFTITANAAPNMDGCFTAATTTDGESAYTVSGTTALSEFAVGPLEFDDGDFKWVIVFIELDGDSSQVFCVSAESASDVNPGNASWICDFTGDFENVLLASSDDISILCGSCDASVPGAATSDVSAACTSGVGVVAVGGAGMVAVASAFADWY